MQISGTISSRRLNKEYLINEVEVRPILYVESLHANATETEITRNWTEVASNLNAKRSDCIKIWNKLVTALKCFHFEPNDSSNNNNNFQYSEQMQFMLPHIINDDGEITQTPAERKYQPTISPPPLVPYLRIADEDDQELQQQQQQQQQQQHHHQSTDDEHQNLISPDLLITNCPVATTSVATTSDLMQFSKVDCAMDNEDLFLLSFAPNLMRMTDKQNALARLRILEELYKLEFEETINDEPIIIVETI